MQRTDKDAIYRYGETDALQLLAKTPPCSGELPQLRIGLEGFYLLSDPGVPEPAWHGPQPPCQLPGLGRSRKLLERLSQGLGDEVLLGLIKLYEGAGILLQFELHLGSGGGLPDLLAVLQAQAGLKLPEMTCLVHAYYWSPSKPQLLEDIIEFNFPNGLLSRK